MYDMKFKNGLNMNLALRALVEKTVHGVETLTRR